MPSYNPRAYISGIRNVARGLSSRTKIIEALEGGRGLRIADVSKKTGLTRPCVTHHLRLLLKRKIVVSSRVGRSRAWTMTSYGQKRLFRDD